MTGAGTGAFGSVIIDVAIGLFFVYFLLSTVASTVQEILAAWFKLRAKDLERGIANIICEPAVLDHLLSHPLIQGVGNNAAETAIVRLFAGKRVVASKRVGKTTASGLPSYLAPQTFSLALASVLCKGNQPTITALRERAQSLIDEAEHVTVDEAKDFAGSLKPARWQVWRRDPNTEQVRELLKDKKLRLGTALKTLLDGARTPQSEVAYVDQLRQRVEAFPATTDVSVAERFRSVVLGSNRLSPAKKTELLQALSAAQSLGQARTAIEEARLGGPLEKLATQELDRLEREANTARESIVGFRTAVEGWYDQAMDHVSGVYKRRTQTWLLCISLVITVVVGADSLRIVRTLFQSPELRSTIANEAIAATGTNGPLNLSAGLTQTAIVVNATAGTPVPTSTPTPAPTPQGTPAPAGGNATPSPTPTRLEAVSKELDVTLPLFGYDDQLKVLTPTWWSTPMPQADRANALSTFLWTLAGLLITTIAVSLGAPFWFDLLQKVANIRAAGDPSTRTDTGTGTGSTSGS